MLLEKIVARNHDVPTQWRVMVIWRMMASLIVTRRGSERNGLSEPAPDTVATPRQGVRLPWLNPRPCPRAKDHIGIGPGTGIAAAVR
jgi:hypothetical protein